MKDNYRSLYVHGVHPCQFSQQCLRLLDALDEYDSSADNQDLRELSSSQDELLVTQLCAHLPTCLTCTLTLARARRVRAQQRAALRGWLAEEALQVPSTISLIRAATTREQAPTYATALARARVAEPSYTYLTAPLSPPPSSVRVRPTTRRSLLAAAAVLVVVLGSTLFFTQMALYYNTTTLKAGYLLSQQTVPARGTLPAKPTLPSDLTPLPPPSWHNVLLASSSAELGATMLFNYDLRTSESTSPTKPLPAEAIIDGISFDGANLLYHLHNSNSGVTYWTLNQLKNQGYFYALTGGGNAIWLPDSRNVLISKAGGGLLEVDTQTGSASDLLPGIHLAKLEFYHEPFLYFLGQEDLEMGALYRVGLRGGTPQRVTNRSPGSTFWLSPDGATVYYANKGSTGQPGIYAVSANDGIQSQRLVSASGVPIGYAADDTLMLIRASSASFQLVQASIPEKIVLSDVAPGAVSLCSKPVVSGSETICDSNIALAPGGGSLVFEASYADDSHKVFSITIPTGKRSLLPVQLSQPDTKFQIVGWNNIVS